MRHVLKAVNIGSAIVTLMLLSSPHWQPVFPWLTSHLVGQAQSKLGADLPFTTLHCGMRSIAVKHWTEHAIEKTRHMLHGFVTRLLAQVKWHDVQRFYLSWSRAQQQVIVEKPDVQREKEEKRHTHSFIVDGRP